MLRTVLGKFVNLLHVLDKTMKRKDLFAIHGSTQSGCLSSANCVLKTENFFILERNRNHDWLKLLSKIRRNILRSCENKITQCLDCFLQSKRETIIWIDEVTPTLIMLITKHSSYDICPHPWSHFCSFCQSMVFWRRQCWLYHDYGFVNSLCNMVCWLAGGAHLFRLRSSDWRNTAAQWYR